PRARSSRSSAAVSTSLPFGAYNATDCAASHTSSARAEIARLAAARVSAESASRRDSTVLRATGLPRGPWGPDTGTGGSKVYAGGRGLRIIAATPARSRRQAIESARESARRRVLAHDEVRQRAPIGAVSDQAERDAVDIDADDLRQEMQRGLAG